MQKLLMATTQFFTQTRCRMQHHNESIDSSSRDVEQLRLPTPLHSNTRINNDSAAISSSQQLKKHSKHKPDSMTITLFFFCVMFLTTMNSMHNSINQFEQETKAQTHFLRRTLDEMLFDPQSLPQHSTLKGRFDGCLVIEQKLAPHSFREAMFVDKDVEIVNGTGTNLINRHRLRAYDYDEVKGLVAAFNNAIVYGLEPMVYDCHVKYRPGGAAALSLNSVQRVLNDVTIGYDGHYCKFYSTALSSVTRYLCDSILDIPAIK